MTLLTVGADGGARRTPVHEYPVKGRGGKGVQTGAGDLVWAGLADVVQVPTAEDVVIVEAGAVPTGRRTARLTQTTAPVTGPVVAQR